MNYTVEQREEIAKWANPATYALLEDISEVEESLRIAHQEFETELTRLSLAWHIPEITHPDVPALDLLSTILGDGRSSRFRRSDSLANSSRNGAVSSPPRRYNRRFAIFFILWDLPCCSSPEKALETSRSWRVH
jgi:hypothetical protein